jgi:hypothetical protein
VVSQVLKPQSSPTHFELFQPGITRASVVCWDDSRYFRQKYFTLDNFRFVDLSGTAYQTTSDQVIEAPQGMELSSDDSLGGTGRIVGDLTNGGMVSPGTSPGTLMVDGGYVQTADGELLIELGGPAVGEFDVLSISGQADLAGTLRIALDGYTPVPGEQFLIMEYETYVGGFDSILTPDGMEADLNYDAPGGLLVTMIPEPASLALLATGILIVIKRQRR